MPLPEGIRIEPVAERHARGYHACLDSVAREKRFLAQIEALPLPRIEAFVRDSVANDAIQFMALTGDTVIGWADIFASWAHAQRHCGSLGMGIHADHRGRGIGRALLEACIEKARAKGITRVVLECRADNVNAIALYERVGFEHEAVKPRALRFDGVYFDAVQMRLLL